MTVLKPAHLLKVAGMAGNLEKRLFAEYHVYELIFSKMILKTRKKLTDVNKNKRAPMEAWKCILCIR